MRIPESAHQYLLERANKTMLWRGPDMVVGAAADPYLHRWRLWDKNTWQARFLGNIYVHRFFRDDDDRALHDHPYDNVSIVLANGFYVQWSINVALLSELIKEHNTAFAYACGQFPTIVARQKHPLVLQP